MNLELFDKPDLSRAAARQRALDDARARGEIAAQRAADRADRDDPEWTARALQSLRTFAAAQAGVFTIEQARLTLELAGLPRPHDGRAWGVITRQAVAAGHIERIRGAFFPAASSNGALKAVYRGTPKAKELHP